VHVDEEFAKASHFGGIVAMGCSACRSRTGSRPRARCSFRPALRWAGTGISLKPIRAGDRLHVKYRIGAMRETKKPGGASSILASE